MTEREGPLDLPGETRDAQVWERFARWRAERRRFVLATVTASRGFTPRKAGAHMLVAGDGATVGTIGGGAIEREVLDRAAALLRDGGSTLLERHLTQELGMCCGGEMAVFLEVIEPAPRLFVFGAGYIAKPLVAIAAGCGFEVTVADGRAEWARAERFPTAALHDGAPEDFLRALESDPSDYAIVVTHDHALDQVLVQELLRRPLRFVGLVGSVPKRNKFVQRLRARGFAERDIARLRCPLGVNVGAATPEEIAVSIVAELVAERRGVTPGAPWIDAERARTEREAGSREAAAREGIGDRREGTP